MDKRQARTSEYSESGNKSRILVTGGAGFIGSHLVDRLVAEGTQVTVIDNFRAGSKDNLNQSVNKIRLVEGDVRDIELVGRILHECSPDVVFHLAANASVPNSVLDPRYDFETNVIGTFNVLNALIGHQIKKFVFASSAAVYGGSSRALKESDPLIPVSPYGTTKLCGENLCLSFKRTYGIPFAIARIFNVYGPRLSRYVMHDFYKGLKKNPHMLKVLGDGGQKRQFCYIGDAVDALLLLADKGESVYNVAGIEPISIDKLARIIVAKTAPGAKISYTGESWPGDIKTLVADISKIRGIGFVPKIKIDKGIDSLIKWFDGTR
jgi:UDP-glucose 4-epimerase